MTSTSSDRFDPIFKVRYWQLRLSDKFHEHRYGIESDAHLSAKQLGVDNPDSSEYSAVPYRVLREILNTLAIKPEDRHVFIDIGCGMGRPLVVAAQYPFRRVIGVEIAADLCKVAQRNIQKIQNEATCRDIQVVHSDALSYPIPDDATVMYFGNPFKGETLHRFIQKIEQSLRAHPRLLRIVYYNRQFFEEEVSGLPWVTKRLHVPSFPHASWAIYEADGRRLAASAKHES